MTLCFILVHANAKCCSVKYATWTQSVGGRTAVDLLPIFTTTLRHAATPAHMQLAERRGDDVVAYLAHLNVALLLVQGAARGAEGRFSEREVLKVRSCVG